MDITKYISNIELPAADEIQLKAFLASKGKELNDSIIKLWDEFILTENVNAGVETHGRTSQYRHSNYRNSHFQIK